MARFVSIFNVLLRVAFLAAFALAIGFTSKTWFELGDVQERMRYRVSENTIWAATQSEMELSRMLSLLAPQAFGGQPVAGPLLARQFDRMWNRAMVYNGGALAEAIRNNETQYRIYKAYFAALEASDDMLEAVVKGDAKTAASMFETLAPHAETLRSLTLESLNVDRREREALSADNDLLQNQLSQFGAASIVLLVMLLVFLIRAERRSRHLLEDANQSRSSLMLEREHSQAQAQRMKMLARKATAASGAKSEFLAMMSHDIRTPLNAIIGLSELLLKDREPGEESRMIGTILRASEGLLTLINDILDLTRLEAGKLPLKLDAFSPRILAQDVLEVASVLAEKNGNQMLVTIDPAVPASLLGDSDRIRQVLLNLVGNANKFTTHGKVELRMDCTSPVEDRDAASCKLRFLVSDTGSGISGEMQEKLFQPFEKGENARHVRGGSTGLGLAISERIVKLMGGHIGFSSEEGKGSVFSFELELDLIGSMKEVMQKKQTDKAAIADLSGRKILIADDVPANLMVARKMFETFGADISTAAGGEEAINLGRQEWFDLVVLDVQMPGTDGVAAMQALRREGVNPGAVYIALTAQSFARDRKRLLDVGFDHYLGKPVRLAEIAGLLENVHHGSQETDRVQQAQSAPLPMAEERDGPENAAGNEAIRQPAPLNIPFIEDLLEDMDYQTFNTLISQVHNEMDNVLPELEHGIELGEDEAVRKAAHKIAGLLDQFGVSAAAHSARTIELSPAPASAGDEVETLIALSRHGLNALREMIDTKSREDGDQEQAQRVA